MSEERTRYDLTVRDQVLFPTWGQMREQAEVLRKSGFFPKSIKSAEQALAVMMMGRELGIGTMESVRSIYPIDGKPTVSAGLMAALILRSGASYTIDKSTAEECVITFIRRSGETYTHTFTLQDAQAAKLTGKGAWVGYKKAMLYNRCMSAGARAFVPNVIMGLYTPEELGAPVIVSGDDVVIDGEAVVIADAPIELDVEEPAPEPQLRKQEPPKPSTNGHPWPAERTREVLRHNAGVKAERWGDAPPSDGQIKAVVSLLSKATGDDDQARYGVMLYTFGKDSTSKLSKAQASTLIDWMTEGAEGGWELRSHVSREVALMLNAHLEERGQQRMPFGATAEQGELV